MSKRHPDTEVICHYFNGGEIQYQSISGQWIDVQEKEHIFQNLRYRKKPVTVVGWFGLCENGKSIHTFDERMAKEYETYGYEVKRVVFGE